MRIISRRRLREFWEQFPDSEEPLQAWHAEAADASWADPPAVKALYRSASILKKGRVVFNVGGNKYRLVVHIRYDKALIFIRFVGTHRQYDEIDADTI